MNTIHNNMVARISPSKPTARPVISPKKAKKLRSCFTCMKCSRRFATRAECSEHIVTHLRAEKAAAAAALQEHNASEAASSEATKAPSASTSPAPMDLTVESSQATVKQQPTDATAITEQDEYDEAMLCAYMREDTSEHAEDVECGQAVTDVVNQIYEDRCRKRTYSMAHKEEKHSHTSGSTSPLSVHIPEGYAQPVQQDAKPFTMQSFLMRPIQLDGFKPPAQVLEELVAFLPVRTTVSEPIKVTFELLPTPQVDEKIQHL
ncbi:zinc finger protein [Aphelenchoides avenae]|nr:zinc finger protein [Aphelenchus avenae]